MLRSNWIIIWRSLAGLCAIWMLTAPLVEAAERPLRLATYNVNNYLVQPRERRTPKSAEAREAVAQVIAASGASIVALQEVGSRKALQRLRQDLASMDIQYPHWAYLDVPGQTVRCAVLSQFPLVADRSRHDVPFLLYGRSFDVLRGVMEVEFQITPEYRLTLFNLHLKSQLPTWYADQQDYRLAEAVTVRKQIDRLIAENPERNIVVVGDLNDTPESPVMRTFVGKGAFRFTDTRPLERSRNTGAGVMGASWTYHFKRRDAYFRYDYILLSKGALKEWKPGSSSIPDHPRWRTASDHRLIAIDLLPSDSN